MKERMVDRRTGRFQLYFTEDELDTLAWLCREEIKVQEQLLDHNDGTLLKQLQELYDSFTW